MAETVAYQSSSRHCLVFPDKHRACFEGKAEFGIALSGEGRHSAGYWSDHCKINLFHDDCSNPCARPGLSILTLSMAQRSIFHSRDVSVKK